MISKPRYVIVDNRGRYYHFWDKTCYGEPQFGDLYNAKVSTAAGIMASIRMLERAGYIVTRELVTPAHSEKLKPHKNLFGL